MSESKMEPGAKRLAVTLREWNSQCIQDRVERIHAADRTAILLRVGTRQAGAPRREPALPGTHDARDSSSLISGQRQRFRSGDFALVWTVYFNSSGRCDVLRKDCGSGDE